ncbi:MAG TPA: glycosyltransferase family 39 protein [Myxococcota bacterium]|nr:glycosyltransferase family 39 protein [Myxococcota bacterium]
MDGLPWLGVAGAIAGSALAFIAERRGRRRAALWLLVLAALCLRIPPAWHLGLSPWDERYHALVALNALHDPFVPELVAQPLSEPAVDDWRHSHVWLHKPPGMTWLIALSYRLFGVNELALRVPSVVLSSLLVLVVFAIARRFASAEAALFAAALAAWNGWVMLLVAGYRASDHVDVGMTFATALGALAALRAAESLDDRRALVRRALGVGALTAAAYYVKETPALVVPAVLFLALRARGASWRASVTVTAGSLAVAAALVLPWLLYTAHAFPELAAFARARGARYFFHVVDGQGGPWYFHFANLDSDFSVLGLLAIAWLGVQAVRRRELRPLAGWIILVYGVFTLAATKMQAYPMVALPAVLCALGWFACDAGPVRLRPILCLLLAAYVVISPVTIAGPQADRPRDPLWASELRGLGQEVAKLPPGKRLVFVPDSPIECMFYTGATCISGQATAEQVADARAKGFAVAVYGAADLPGVTAIPFDPRALPARRLAAALRARAAKDVAVFNARDARQLESYLGRSIHHADVSAELPRKSRRLERKQSQGTTLIVLLQPGTPQPEAVKSEFPDAVFLEDASYARALDSKAP